MYTFDCRDIQTEKFTSIKFAQEPFALVQNCDMLEIYKIYDVNELRLWYDDGSKTAVYSPAFDCIYVDSQALKLTVWISEENRTDANPKNGFSSICIHIENPELMFQIKEFFAFDKMIALEYWL